MAILSVLSIIGGLLTISSAFIYVFTDTTQNDPKTIKRKVALFSLLVTGSFLVIISYNIRLII